MNLILLADNRFIPQLAEELDVDIKELIIHTLACLSCIIHPRCLFLADDAASNFATIYKIDKPILTQLISQLVQELLPRALTKLNEWDLIIVVSARQAKSESEKALFLNARLNLAVGRANIAEQLGRTRQQIEYYGELIYLSDRLLEDQLNNFCRQKLIDLYRDVGELPSLVRELVRQTRKYIVNDKNYDDAIRTLLIAKTVAKEVSNPVLDKQIETYWSLANFLSQ